MESIKFLNLEYFFGKAWTVIQSIINIIGQILSGGNFPLSDALKIISAFLCLFFIAGTIYAHLRKREIKAEEKKKYEAYFVTAEVEKTKNERWARIEALFDSINAADWRLAIIEADAVLDELILSLGYPGENLGERMKGIDTRNFPTIQDAWEAHKIRNRIAHDGLNFNLTEREARRVKMLYQHVFEDSEYI